jgi:hypothetical protein
MRHVALTGIVAEAKAIASENGERNVASSQELVESILEIVHHKLPNAAEKVWEVAIPLEGGGSQTANLTRADLEMIPALDQIGPMLGPTLV